MLILLLLITQNMGDQPKELILPADLILKGAAKENRCLSFGGICHFIVDKITFHFRADIDANEIYTQAGQLVFKGHEREKHQIVMYSDGVWSAVETQARLNEVILAKSTFIVVFTDNVFMVFDLKEAKVFTYDRPVNKKVEK